MSTTEGWPHERHAHRFAKRYFFWLFPLALLATDYYVHCWKDDVTKVEAPAKLPPRAQGEVLVTWPVLVGQFDRTKPECVPLRERAETVASSWQGWLPLPVNIWDDQLLKFKLKARQAGCLVLDKGETY